MSVLSKEKQHTTTRSNKGISNITPYIYTNIIDDCVAFRSFAFFLAAHIPNPPTKVIIIPIIDDTLSIPFPLN